jgi:hypothetical protein
MTDFAALLEALAANDVQFILIGGLAAAAHGSARSTLDVDVVYERDLANVERLVKALAPYGPYRRGVPPGLPFRWGRETLLQGLNFTLTTTLGAIDLLGEIAGGGSYHALRDHTVSLRLFGRDYLCLDLPTLIHVKRAAGRPKDLEAIAELEILLEQQDGPNG